MPAKPWVLIAVLGAIAPAGACAAFGDSSTADKPAWFVARSKALSASGHPDLASVPKATKGARSASTWAAVEAEVRAAGDEVQASPRNVPADISDLATFEAEARKAATPPPALGTPAAPAAPAAKPPAN